MKKGEKVLLSVKPQCKLCICKQITSEYFYSFVLISCLLCLVDGFGEQGKPTSGDEGAVPPNATLQITLELVSWKTVANVTDDKKVVKKILKEGEGYDRPNEGAVVQCKDSL